MLVLKPRIHDMERLFTAIEAFLYERQQHAVFFIQAVEERANMPLASQGGAGKMNALLDSIHRTYASSDLGPGLHAHHDMHLLCQAIAPRARDFSFPVNPWRTFRWFEAGAAVDYSKQPVYGKIRALPAESGGNPLSLRRQREAYPSIT